jgi:serine phosphatase RsbU (regulator of sigma subunit)
MPIGIFINEDEEVPFTNHVLEIRKDDVVYIFSDGFQDQFGGEKRKKFYSNSFNNLLLEISNETLQKQKEILENTLNIWRGSEPQLDDIVVIGFKI